VKLPAQRADALNTTALRTLSKQDAAPGSNEHTFRLLRYDDRVAELASVRGEQQPRGTQTSPPARAC
jgi:hypothetical protein